MPLQWLCLLGSSRALVVLMSPVLLAVGKVRLQVFFNLILNARDAMPRGGWLTLATSADTDTVVVEVKDTGPGIRRDHLRRIYDPCFTTKGLGRGTGLGLSVSYGIIQEHGGAIFVDSTPGQGTRFQVALPALVASEAAQQG